MALVAVYWLAAVLAAAVIVGAALAIVILPTLTSPLGAADQLPSLIWQALYEVLSAVVQTLYAVATLAARVVEFLSAHLRTLIVMALLVLVAREVARYGTPALRGFDATVTRDVAPFYRNTVLPIANAARLAYGSAVCFYDTYASFGRLLEQELLREGAECTEMHWRTTLSALVATLQAPGIAIADFAAANFDADLDLYHTVRALGLLIDSFRPLAECLCRDLAFVPRILGGLVTIDALPVAVNDLFNAALRAARVLIGLARDILTGRLFQQNHDPERAPKFGPAIDKLCFAAEATGVFLDDGLNVIFHTFVDTSITFPRPGGAAAEAVCTFAYAGLTTIDAVFHVDLLFYPQVRYLETGVLANFNLAFQHARNATGQLQAFFDDVQRALNDAAALIPEDPLEVELPNGQTATLSAQMVIMDVAAIIDDAACVVTNTANATLGALQIAVDVALHFAQAPSSPFSLIRRENLRLFLDGVEGARDCARRLVAVLNPVLGDLVYIVIDVAEHVVQAVGGIVIRLDSFDLLSHYLGDPPGTPDSLFGYVNLVVDDVELLGITLGNFVRQINFILPDSTASPPHASSCLVADFPLDVTLPTNLAPITLFCCFGGALETAVRLVASLLRLAVLIVYEVSATVLGTGNVNSYTVFQSLVDSIRGNFVGPPFRLGVNVHLLGFINEAICVPASLFALPRPLPCSGKSQSSGPYLTSSFIDIGVTAVNSTGLAPYYATLGVLGLVADVVAISHGSGSVERTIRMFVLTLYDISVGALVNSLRATTQFLGCILDAGTDGGGLSGFGSALFKIFGWRWPPGTNKTQANKNNFRSVFADIFAQLVRFIQLVVAFFTNFPDFIKQIGNLIKCDLFPKQCSRKRGALEDDDGSTASSSSHQQNARSDESTVYAEWGDNTADEHRAYDERLSAAYAAVADTDIGDFDRVASLLISCGMDPAVEFAARVSGCASSCVSGACDRCAFGTVSCQQPSQDAVAAASPSNWPWFDDADGAAWTELPTPATLPCADLVVRMRATNDEPTSFLLSRELERCLWSAGASRYADVVLLQPNAARPVVPRDAFYSGGQAMHVAHRLARTVLVVSAYQGNATLQLLDVSLNGTDAGQQQQQQSVGARTLAWPQFVAAVGEENATSTRVDEITLRVGLLVETLMVQAAARSDAGRGIVTGVLAMAQQVAGGLLGGGRALVGIWSYMLDARDAAMTAARAVHEVDWVAAAERLRSAAVVGDDLRALMLSAGAHWRNTIRPIAMAVVPPTNDTRLLQARTGAQRVAAHVQISTRAAAQRAGVPLSSTLIGAVFGWNDTDAAAAADNNTADAGTVTNDDDYDNGGNATRSTQARATFISTPGSEVCIGSPTSGICIECKLVSNVIERLTDIAFGCLADVRPTLLTLDADAWRVVYDRQQDTRRATRAAQLAQLDAARQPVVGGDRSPPGFLVSWLYKAIFALSGGRIDAEQLGTDIGQAGVSQHDPANDIGTVFHYVRALVSCDIEKAVRPRLGAQGLGLRDGLKWTLVGYLVLGALIYFLVPNGGALLTFAIMLSPMVLLLLAYDYAPRCLLGMPLLPDTLGDDAYDVLTVFDRQCIDWNGILPGTVRTSTTGNRCPTAVEGYTQDFIDPYQEPYRFRTELRSLLFLIRWQAPSAYAFLFTTRLPLFAFVRELPTVAREGDFDFSASHGRIDDRWTSAFYRTVLNLAALVVELLLIGFALDLVGPLLVSLARAGLALLFIAVRIALQAMMVVTGAQYDPSSYFYDVNELALYEVTSRDRPYTPRPAARLRPQWRAKAD